MSEAERKRRLDYRKIRRKWISWQALILAVVLMISLVATVFAVQCSKVRYINYQEKSQVDYGVYLKDNDFYEQNYLGKDYAYVAALIDRVAADFRYQLQMDTHRAIEFEYTYRIDAVLEITEASTGKLLLNPTTEVLPAKTVTTSGKSVNVRERVEIDYAGFNDLANDYIKTYELSGVRANIVLQMHVSVKGNSEEFNTSQSSNSYVSSISIPVAAKTVNVQITSSIPPEESKILGYNPNLASAFAFKVLALAFASVGALLGITLILFVYLTKNTDITYDIKVSRLIKSYKSYIQRIKNAFDTAGYQLLLIDTFEEMLEIRDTIQSPILMHENEDRTCTSFYIPTATKILYLYEIKVEDYDEIYNRAEEPEESEIEAEEDTVCAMAEAFVAEEPVEEAVDEERAMEERAEAAPVAEESVVEEPAAKEPAPATEDENASSPYSGVRRSFLAKLIQSDDAKKRYYSEIKNELLSYRAVKARTAWGQESYKKGHTHLAKLAIRGKTLCLYVALDPAGYAESKYFFTDVSDKPQFAAVPMMMKIKSERGVKHAKELISVMAELYGLQRNPSFEPVDYVLPYQTTQELASLGLIKNAGVEEDVDVLLIEDVDMAALDEALKESDPVLSEIDYVDRAVEDAEDGVEVVDVVWKERESGNTLHQYDPDGLELSDGDVVLVSATNEEGKPNGIRKAAVAHANHKVSPDTIESPLQKLLGVLRRTVQSAMQPKNDE